MPVNIVCCVKQVPDPETPASAFRVDEGTKKVMPAPGIAPVISQFDAIAVEAALRVKENAGDGKVTVLSLGPDSARDVIKVGLAMGADEGVLLNDPALFDGDSFATANALAAAIKKIGDVNLVLCGRQAVDWDFGVTGLTIAEMLGWPSISITKSVSCHRQHGPGRARPRRLLRDGRSAAARRRHRQQRAGRAPLPQAAADHGRRPASRSTSGPPPTSASARIRPARAARASSWSACSSPP